MPKPRALECRRAFLIDGEVRKFVGLSLEVYKNFCLLGLLYPLTIRAYGLYNGTKTLVGKHAELLQLIGRGSSTCKAFPLPNIIRVHYLELIRCCQLFVGDLWLELCSFHCHYIKNYIMRQDL